MSETRRRSILAWGLAGTNRCDWTAAVSRFYATKRLGSFAISFARVRSQKGLTAWPGQVSHRCVQSLRQEGPTIEPGAVLTLFWSRRVGMGPGPRSEGPGLDPDG
jgi:hypothetical protein